ncbi:hypothetical protein BN1708_009671 [Verticillium longisporum]|uniref:Uncharacterized protein n=1 Tax=Verticillium longisporum TaxID=100787 RepID=A0A0G4KKF2_VERLO|nr:hypothetical protein BN1708_009671 [Verticillium longisporum]
MATSRLFPVPCCDGTYAHQWDKAVKTQAGRKRHQDSSPSRFCVPSHQQNPPWRTGPFPTGRGMMSSAGTDPLSLCLTRRPGSGGGRCRSARDPANYGAAVARSICSTGVWEELPCLGMRGAGGKRCGGRVRLALLSVSSVKRVASGRHSSCSGRLWQVALGLEFGATEFATAHCVNERSSGWNLRHIKGPGQLRIGLYSTSLQLYEFIMQGEKANFTWYAFNRLQYTLHRIARSLP